MFVFAASGERNSHMYHVCNHGAHVPNIQKKVLERVHIIPSWECNGSITEVVDQEIYTYGLRGDSGESTKFIPSSYESASQKIVTHTRSTLLRPALSKHASSSGKSASVSAHPSKSLRAPW